MKHADIETLVWLIIAVMIVLAKGWSKLQGQIDKDSSESEKAPPVLRPKLQRPRPQPRPAQVGARSVAAPIRRTAQPVQRTEYRTAPAPVGSPPPRQSWRVDPEQIRRFMEQLSGQARPAPPPIAHPAVQKAEAPAPPLPAPATPQPPATVPAMASATAPPSRAAQWAEALRDRQNIRNIIISAEIIGPPKSL